MQTTFNMNLWLLHTSLLMVLLLLALPTLRTLIGLLLIALSQGLYFEKLGLRSLGIKVLPNFIRGLLGLGLGLGLTGISPVAADEVIYVDRVSSYQEISTTPETTKSDTFRGADVESPYFIYEVQPGDSLWAIASKSLSESKQDPTIGELDLMWRHIWRQNRTVIGDDPSLIQPGMKLRISDNALTAANE
jgi:hypothetical protein